LQICLRAELSNSSESFGWPSFTALDKRIAPTITAQQRDSSLPGLGASRIEQLTDTLAAADYKLESAVKAKLDEASIEYRRGDAGK
jgi:hypothetical protein